MRICAGIARVGVDTEESTLAAEAAIEDHLSLTKGCYTGQEIVARIHTYGHVNRRLRLLEIDSAEAISVGTVLVEPGAGDPVGRVMSSSLLPDGRRRAALGYLPSDFGEPGSRLRLGTREGPLVQVRKPDE